MIGHAQIAQIRKQGKRPTAIFFEVDELPAVRYRFEHPENALKWGMHPTVFLTNDEAGQKLDLRFVIGCRVIVSCPVMTDEVTILADTLHTAGASAIYCCGLFDATLLYCEKGEWHANT